MTRDEYLRSVGYRLNDLPWSLRRDLLAELAATLTSSRPAPISARSLDPRRPTPKTSARRRASNAAAG